MKLLYLIVPLAPLIGAIIAGLFSKTVGRSGAHWVTILGVMVSFIASVIVFRDVMAGRPGPVRDIVVLNAAAALLAYRGVSTVQPLLDQLRGPLAAAQAAIDSGHAAATLEAWIAATR